MGFFDGVRKKVKRAQDKYQAFEVDYRKNREQNLEKEYSRLQEEAKLVKLQKRNTMLKRELYGKSSGFSTDVFGHNLLSKKKNSGHMNYWEY